MAIKEADRKRFKLDNFKKELLHLKEEKTRLHALERLSVNPDFLVLKQIQQNNIKRCEINIQEASQALAGPTISIEHERKLLGILREQIATKNSLEEMLSLVGPFTDSIQNIDERLDLIREEIEKLDSPVGEEQSSAAV